MPTVGTIAQTQYLSQFYELIRFEHTTLILVKRRFMDVSIVQFGFVLVELASKNMSFWGFDDENLGDTIT